MRTPFRDKLDKFVNEMQRNYDRLDVRIGNEIIL
jgi:hypothetical protein